jgi:hypothetical protein
MAAFSMLTPVRTITTRLPLKVPVVKVLPLMTYW